MNAIDPVLERRERIRGLVSTGQRIGYILFGVALVLFIVGFIAGFEDWLASMLVALLIAGSVVLAPSIVFAYAVTAADRADDEDDW